MRDDSIREEGSRTNLPCWCSLPPHCLPLYPAPGEGSWKITWANPVGESPLRPEVQSLWHSQGLYPPPVRRFIFPSVSQQRDARPACSTGSRVRPSPRGTRSGVAMLSPRRPLAPLIRPHQPIRGYRWAPSGAAEPRLDFRHLPLHLLGHCLYWCFSDSGLPLRAFLPVSVPSSQTPHVPSRAVCKLQARSVGPLWVGCSCEPDLEGPGGQLLHFPVE